MAVTLVRAKGHDGYGYYPEILCDVCGLPIEAASEGYVVWNCRPEVCDLQFIHKARCDNRERAMSMPLDDFLLNLLFNAKYDGPVEAEEESDE